VYFIALVRTKSDERCADLVDDMLRHADLRMSVCRDQSRAALLECLLDAKAAFDPSAATSVRYSSLQDALWVEFGDGMSGSVDWSSLGMAKVVDSLVRESAVIGSRGRTIELSTLNDDVFEIDADSIRGLVDTAYRARLSQAASQAAEHLGARLRAVRERLGLTQVQLAERTGLDQAIISKLERGVHEPRLSTLERIGAAMGLSVSALVLDDSDAVARPVSDT
jgi:DNA-binding XRE family transcriptional regulator